MDLEAKIRELKKKRNAVILAHLYQWPPVQDIADFVGDSLDLSKMARDTDADIILFCGVYFMAETAKILSPNRMVLLPEIDAGCPMADMITPEDVDRMRKENPEAAVVCYVNSSAKVKARSDICCTSSNAVKVVQSLKERKIIFIPDQNLGHYVSRFVPDKEFTFPKGFCPTHHRILIKDVKNAKAAKPGVLVLVHPECRPEVVDVADFVGSTSQIITYVEKSHEREFIIGTESGILYPLHKRCPNKRFYTLHAAMVCPNMKKTSLESVYRALTQDKYPIDVEPSVRLKAKKSLDRMLSVKV
jgi:quinolinate synthase